MPGPLADIQRGLAALVLGDGPPEFARWVSVPPDVDPAGRLAVYQGGYPIRIYEALEQCFPAIRTILGEGSFGALTSRYLPSAPHGWCNLNDVGRALPGALVDDALTTELPFLPDLARLEWAVFSAFHAALGSPVDLAECETWDLDRWALARFELRPDVALVSSKWPIRDLWEVRELPREEIDVSVTDRPQTAWVERSGFDVEVSLCDDREVTFIRSLLRGDSLGDAMDELARAGVDAEVAAPILSRFVDRGWVAAIR